MTADVCVLKKTGMGLPGAACSQSLLFKPFETSDMTGERKELYSLVKRFVFSKYIFIYYLFLLLY